MALSKSNREEEIALESVDRDVILLVAVAIMRDGRILLVREEAEPYNHEWVLPQGYVKSNETLGEAAAREVREELGVTVEMQNIVGVYEDFVQSGERGLHYVTVCFLGRISGQSEIHSTQEVIDSVWIDPSKGRDNAPRVIQRILKDVSRVAKKRFSPIRYSFGV